MQATVRDWKRKLLIRIVAFTIAARLISPIPPVAQVVEAVQSTAQQAVQQVAAVVAPSPTVFPLKPADFLGYTSPYGDRVHPVTGAVGSFHAGQDMAADIGAPILAWKNGTVESLEADPNAGCGLALTIDHGQWQTRYCHANRLLVKQGQTVKAGEMVAEVGTTGRSTGPHLHFEIYFGGELKNATEVLQTEAQEGRAPKFT